MSRIAVSKKHSYLSGRNARPYILKAVTDSAVNELNRLGIQMDADIVGQQVSLLFDRKSNFVGDAAFTAPITQGSIPTPLQFLQNWLPGFVKILTTARKIDDLIGVKTVGSWEDEEIVQGIIEPAGMAAEYGDYTNVPLASWNTNFERRGIVRGELGIAVGLLEEARSAAMRVASAEEKRQSAAISLEIMRNAIGFYGWNNGKNRTFGFLNDPNLPAYITSTTANGWSSASFQQIQSDIRAMIVQLRTQSGDNIDPEKVDLTLALPTNKVDMISVTTDMGISVRDWISQTYKRIRIVSAPELTGAVPATGGHTGDVAYLFADDIDQAVDGSSDGGETFAQLVVTKFVTHGVEKRVKTYIEDYGNATAGSLCKRPWAVVRMLGI